MDENFIPGGVAISIGGGTAYPPMSPSPQQITCPQCHSSVTTATHCRPSLAGWVIGLCVSDHDQATISTSRSVLYCTNTPSFLPSSSCSPLGSVASLAATLKTLSTGKVHHLHFWPPKLHTMFMQSTTSILAYNPLVNLFQLIRCPVCGTVVGVYRDPTCRWVSHFLLFNKTNQSPLSPNPRSTKCKTVPQIMTKINLNVIEVPEDWPCINEKELHFNFWIQCLQFIPTI